MNVICENINIDMHKTTEVDGKFYNSKKISGLKCTVDGFPEYTFCFADEGKNGFKIYETQTALPLIHTTKYEYVDDFLKYINSKAAKIDTVAAVKMKAEIERIKALRVYSTIKRPKPLKPIFKNIKVGKKISCAVRMRPTTSSETFKLSDYIAVPSDISIEIFCEKLPSTERFALTKQSKGTYNFTHCSSGLSVIYTEESNKDKALAVIDEKLSYHYFIREIKAGIEKVRKMGLCDLKVE